MVCCAALECQLTSAASARPPPKLGCGRKIRAESAFVRLWVCALHIPFFFSEFTTIGRFRDNRLGCWTPALEFLAAKKKNTLKTGILGCRVKDHLDDEFANTLGCLLLEVEVEPECLRRSFFGFVIENVAMFFSWLRLPANVLLSCSRTQNLLTPPRTMEASILLFRLTSGRIVPPTLSVKF